MDNKEFKGITMKTFEFEKKEKQSMKVEILKQGYTHGEEKDPLHNRRKKGNKKVVFIGKEN